MLYVLKYAKYAKTLYAQVVVWWLKSKGKRKFHKQIYLLKKILMLMENMR